MTYSACPQFSNQYNYYPVRLNRSMNNEKMQQHRIRRMLLTYGDSATETFMPHILKFNCSDILLDSGAFTKKAQRGEITIQGYCDFLHTYQQHFTGYINFDKLGDPETTERNQAFMEKEGLTPIPVYHRGSPLSIVRDMFQEHSYICIGNLVGATLKDRMATLDKVFEHFRPGVKVHLLGMSTWELLIRYPAWSSDSRTSTWPALKTLTPVAFDPADRTYKRWSMRDPHITWANRKLLALSGMDILDLPADTSKEDPIDLYLLRQAASNAILFERCVREDRARIGTNFELYPEGQCI